MSGVLDVTLITYVVAMPSETDTKSPPLCFRNVENVDCGDCLSDMSLGVILL